MEETDPSFIASHSSLLLLLAAESRRTGQVWEVTMSGYIVQFYHLLCSIPPALIVPDLYISAKQG